jgi:hypothetical protein
MTNSGCRWLCEGQDSRQGWILGLEASPKHQARLELAAPVLQRLTAAQEVPLRRIAFSFSLFPSHTLRQRCPKKMRKCFIFLLTFVAAVPLLFISSRQHPSAFHAYAEDGTLLNGFFEEAPPRDASFLPSTKKPACSSSSLLGKLMQTSVVYAQSCAMTLCTGHYLVPDYFECCPAWGEPYRFHYGDPNVNYSSGYRFTGLQNCRFCPSGGCDESSCQH